MDLNQIKAKKIKRSICELGNSAHKIIFDNENQATENLTEILTHLGNGFKAEKFWTNESNNKVCYRFTKQ